VTVMMWLTCRLFQHIGALEQKVAALESEKLLHSVDRGQRGVHVSDDIEHLEKRLRRAEADLVYMDNTQRSSELQENSKVSSFLRHLYFLTVCPSDSEIFFVHNFDANHVKTINHCKPLHVPRNEIQ